MKFKDLSWPIKTAVVMSWILGVIYGLLVLMAILQGFWYEEQNGNK